ncbi:isocyanide synthase family protein [Pendulispora rubella]|uniref:Isocyanide synthase family protein n=1 Tax=Pendulispora rubella TaxID=2741070 RepID=A0ABZ2L233_9BACT
MRDLTAIVGKFVARGEPVRMVLPGYPYKSLSERKCTGVDPDDAEVYSLLYLDSILKEIRAIYAPGAKLIIFSDGRPYSAIVGVPDENVTRYVAGIRRILRSIRAEKRIEAVTLEDLKKNEYGNDFDAMRRWLMDTYGVPLEHIDEAIKSEPDLEYLYTSMKRFRFEDMEGRPHTVVIDPNDRSRQPVSYSSLGIKAKRRVVGDMAKRGMQLAMAWDAFLQNVDGEALRLSSNRKRCGSKKFSIATMPGSNRHTPWHGAAVTIPMGREEGTSGASIRVIQRRVAEEYQCREVVDPASRRPVGYMYPAVDEDHIAKFYVNALGEVPPHAVTREWPLARKIAEIYEPLKIPVPSEAMPNAESVRSSFRPTEAAR